MSEQSEVIKKLIKCVNFAAIKHANQRRKDLASTPYINHPIGVAHILTDEANITDPVVIQAAILHDTVEDTDTTLDEIEMVFGKDVSDVVYEVTDNKLLPKMVRKKLQIVHASSSSHNAKLVKLADKIYNLRDLESGTPNGWDEARVKEYFAWSKDVVEGLKGTNKKMESILEELFKKHVIDKK